MIEFVHLVRQPWLNIQASVTADETVTSQTGETSTLPGNKKIFPLCSEMSCSILSSAGGGWSMLPLWREFQGDAVGQVGSQSGLCHQSSGAELSNRCICAVSLKPGARVSEGVTVWAWGFYLESEDVVDDWRCSKKTTKILHYGLEKEAKNNDIKTSKGSWWYNIQMFYCYCLVLWVSLLKRRTVMFAWKQFSN